MRVVHKYLVPVFQGSEDGYPRMPRRAELLYADAIDDLVYVWALVELDDAGNTSHRNCLRRLAWFKTGEAVPGFRKYVDSFTVPDALGVGQPFEGHVFDGGEVAL